MAIKDGRQHKRLVEKSVDALLVSLDTDNTVLCERARGYNDVRLG